jgi:serine/threonine protein kinase
MGYKPEEMMTLDTGVLLNNRYRIIEILGQGGMGSVYRAIDENLGVQVAVKENLFLTDEYARQFRREATILAGLRHPNLPRVGDHFDIPGEGQYMVMDFIEGIDLRERLEQTGPLSEEEGVQIGLALCSALIYLHNRPSPVVHRDIKPGNVKLAPGGHIVLVDFGLAKEMLPGHATTSGARAMTPGFSPPEQYGTARTDPRTDIYSLGATLYTALTGTIPEDGLARATGNAELTSLAKLQPRINRRLAAAIEKSLSLRTDDRFQTAQEFQLALQDAANRPSQPLRNTVTRPPPRPAQPVLHGPNDGSNPPSANPPFLADPSQSWRLRGSTLVWIVIGLMLLAASSMVILGFIQNRKSSQLPQIGPTLQATGSVPTQTDTPTITLTAAPLIPTSTLFNPSATPTPAPSLTPTPIPGPTETPLPAPTPFGGSGEIAFVSERSGKPQIWVMNADGSNQHQISDLPSGACQPDWSPDGKQLVFISPCANRQVRSFLTPGVSMYIINADGTNLHPLPMTPEGDFNPHWSPDGQKIVFTSLRSGYAQIFLFSIKDLMITPLSNSDFLDKQPRWSPDGNEIVFVRERPNTTNEIWLMAADGSNQRKFASSSGLNNIWPTFRPDGKYILFGQTTINLVSPWLMAMQYDKAGTHSDVRIPASYNLQPTTYIAEASASPDSFWITFEGWSGADTHNIYIMTITGSDPIRLTVNASLNYSPVWKPFKK